jgi:hypothetical protein
MEYRKFSPDLEVRRGEPSGRTIYGIAVPYNAPTRINDGLTEMFVRGAFNHQIGRPGRVKFAREHLPLGGTLIGAATLLRDDAAGLYTEFRVSKTPTGDETLELVRDGALDELSIGFMPDPRGNNRRGDGTVMRTRADLREVAVVLEGAYGRMAVAAGVRSAEGAQLGDLSDIPEFGEPEPVQEDELIVRARALLERGGLPELPDLDTQLRRIEMGL